MRDTCKCDFLILEETFTLYSLSLEEEMKRFQQALREDGAYNSVAFNYQYNASEHQHLQSDSNYEATQNEGM